MKVYILFYIWISFSDFTNFKLEKTVIVCDFEGGQKFHSSHQFLNDFLGPKNV